jgi:hypothetical protein
MRQRISVHWLSWSQPSVIASEHGAICSPIYGHVNWENDDKPLDIGFFLQYPSLRQSQIPEKFTRNDSPNKKKTSWPVLTAAYVLKACVLFALVSSSPIGKAAILSHSAWMCILRFQPFLCGRCFVNHIQLVLYHSQLTIGDGELLYDVGYDDHPFAQSG